MITQLTFGQSAELAKRDAIQQSIDNADDVFRRLGQSAVTDLARRFPTLTVNDVRNRLTAINAPKPHEPRAYGGLMTWAQGRGLIEPCGAEPSGRERNHNNRITIWKSRVYESLT